MEKESEAIHLKLTQYCKSTIVKSKNIVKGIFLIPLIFNSIFQRKKVAEIAQVYIGA